MLIGSVCQVYHHIVKKIDKHVNIEDDVLNQYQFNIQLSNYLIIH